MKNFDYNLVAKKDFWEMADELQDETINHSYELFKFTETATPEKLISILIQYRFFTIYYIPDLAILIARLSEGRLRSFLADILADELGYGDINKSHPRIYDNFLKSIGVDTLHLDQFAIRDNINLLDQIRHSLVDRRKSVAYGIGLRGMGGECICQIYLAKLYEHIVKNSFIQKNKDSIDWLFWDLHTGDHDIAHRKQTRALINEEIVDRESKDVVDLGKGFYESMSSWRTFWDNIFKSLQQTHVDRTHIDHQANFGALAIDNI